MQPTGRPVRFTLTGCLTGAVIGTILFLQVPGAEPAAATPSALQTSTTEAAPVTGTAPLVLARGPSTINPTPGDRGWMLPVALREEDHLARRALQASQGKISVFTRSDDTASAPPDMAAPEIDPPMPAAAMAADASAAPTADSADDQPDLITEALATLSNPAPASDTVTPDDVPGGVTLAGLFSPPPLLQSSAFPEPAAKKASRETAQPFAPSPTHPVELTVTVSAGDTLMGLLLDSGVSRSEAHEAIEALRDTYDPRDIRPGYALTLTFLPEGEETLLFQGMTFEPQVGKTIRLAHTDDDAFVAELQEAKEQRQTSRYDGIITSSLFEAGLDVGASQSALAEMIRIFSYDVDFQRDIRRDDSFQVFYDQYYTEDGRLIRTGDILYASLTLSGTVYQLYRFEDTDGNVDYYNAKGEGVRKPLLRTPINGARLSSGFGMRHHPVLGYSKMHKGVDFAAPTGTPIFAAGDGVVERANRFSSFGNYIRIRHNNTFHSAYAHLNGFARGITAGSRVKQGQVIGYVGTTGRSTGPHLHYELLQDGKNVNPIKVRFPASKTLEGKELAAFKKERQRIQYAFDNTPTTTKVARAD